MIDYNDLNFSNKKLSNSQKQVYYMVRAKLTAKKVL